MPIIFQKAHDRVLSGLDSEGTDRYTFAQDTKHAGNYAQEWIISAFNHAFADGKLSPECLRELSTVKIWQANAFSRVAFNPADVGNNDYWTIIAVYPNPTTNIKTGLPALIDDAKSRFMPNLSFIKGKAAKRLTMEQWEDAEDNVFMPGNNVLKGLLLRYAYLDSADYSSTSYQNPVPFEIEVRPDISKQLCAIAYIRQPKEITSIGDIVEFPAALMNLFVERMLAFISYKQGDGTNIFSISEKDTARLVALMS